MHNTLFKKLSLILISFVFSLILVEFFLRILGFTPWTYIPSKNQKMFDFDQNIGWKSKEGVYDIIASEEYKIKKVLTVLNNGNRYSGEGSGDQQIIIVGGSFTQGWGVNDNETFSYKLQKKLKNFNVKNYGQSGYSGVQSYLLLKELLQESKNPRLVIYAFIDHHEYRNVARGEWLEMLLKYSKTGHANSPKVPFATLNKKNELVFHEPSGYLQLPLREQLSFVPIIEKTIMKHTAKKRKKQQKEVARQVFLEMKNISKEFNSKFLMVNLKSNIIEYESFFKKNNISFVDCNLSLTENYLIKGDYHPNNKAHTIYSKCINDYINKEKLLLF
tara:strand:+ start:3566 stop:4558 length:993 start_codon:yes stop_codon:yes gene_type:complete